MKSIYFLLFLMLACMDISVAGDRAEYVGRDSCAQCHEEQVKLWRGSHHDLAMQHADEDTVLGDFSGTEFTYAGITSKFYRKNKKFVVRTDGPDGEAAVIMRSGTLLVLCRYSNT